MLEWSVLVLLISAVVLDKKYVWKENATKKNREEFENLKSKVYFRIKIPDKNEYTETYNDENGQYYDYDSDHEKNDVGKYNNQEYHYKERKFLNRYVDKQKRICKGEESGYTTKSVTNSKDDIVYYEDDSDGEEISSDSSILQKLNPLPTAIFNKPKKFFKKIYIRNKFHDDVGKNDIPNSFDNQKIMAAKISIGYNYSADCTSSNLRDTTYNSSSVRDLNTEIPLNHMSSQEVTSDLSSLRNHHQTVPLANEENREWNWNWDWSWNPGSKTKVNILLLDKQYDDEESHTLFSGLTAPIKSKVRPSAQSYQLINDNLSKKMILSLINEIPQKSAGPSLITTGSSNTIRQSSTMSNLKLNSLQTSNMKKHLSKTHNYSYNTHKLSNMAATIKKASNQSHEIINTTMIYDNETIIAFL